MEKQFEIQPTYQLNRFFVEQTAEALGCLPVFLAFDPI
jgi:hypothetical protein